MSQTYFHIAEDVDFSPSRAADGRSEGSYARRVWTDAGAENPAAVAVWRATPGTYSYPARALDETFVVLSGTALCQVGAGEEKEIGPGTIVNIAKGETITLQVHTELRKVATVIPKP
ncbi:MULTISPECIES: cupin domain-containing protein [unclassified Paraburkholderia]|uniref:cupin domain-containing protein n=1 Tax=unclassified Paraburkholderia TaxID=2615204 RepID=UPI002AB2187C|nr:MULTISPECIES: cupin domain-containing protein [unclassified Paraburkholderia]